MIISQAKKQENMTQNEDKKKKITQLKYTQNWQSLALIFKDIKIVITTIF